MPHDNERNPQPGRSYPIASGPTTCSWQPVIQRRHWRFSRVDPATDSDKGHPRGRKTAWCIGCGRLLEVQEEGTGRVLWSGFPHRVQERPEAQQEAER